MRRIARKILRVPAKAPNLLLALEMIAMPMKSTILQNSVRVQETLRLLPPPFDRCPAARLNRFTAALPNNKYTLGAKVAAAVFKECKPYGRLGQAPVPRAILPRAETLLGLAPALAIFKRTLAASSLWASFTRDNVNRNPRTRSSRNDAITSSLRPSPLPPSRHLADLYCIGFTPSTVEIAQASRATPLSVAAGGWTSGSWLHASTIPPPSPGIILNRTGRMAFGFSPYSDGSEYPITRPGSPTKPNLFNKYLVEGACPLCQHQHDDPFHLFCECPQNLLVIRRAELRLSLLNTLQQLMVSIRKAIRNERIDLQSALPIIQDTLLVEALCQGNPFANIDDLNFVTFHFICAVPWSSRLPTAAIEAGINVALPLTTAIGRLFDQTILTNRWAKPIINTTVAWANHWTLIFAKIRRELLSINTGITTTNAPGAQ
jgi:hypothetical protein